MKLTKTFLIVLGFFLINLTFDTCGDPRELEFDLETIGISFIDNSGEWAALTTSQNINPATFGLHIYISEIYEYKRKTASLFGFRKCLAFQPATNYAPSSNIKAINVFGVGESDVDISEYFWAKPLGYNNYNNTLYIEISELEEQINKQNVFNEPVIEFDLYLKEGVDISAFSKFRIEITLENETLLSSDSPEFQL